MLLVSLKVSNFSATKSTPSLPRLNKEVLGFSYSRSALDLVRDLALLHLQLRVICFLQPQNVQPAQLCSLSLSWAEQHLEFQSIRKHVMAKLSA